MSLLPDSDLCRPLWRSYWGGNLSYSISSSQPWSRRSGLAEDPAAPIWLLRVAKSPLSSFSDCFGHKHFPTCLRHLAHVFPVKVIALKRCESQRAGIIAGMVPATGRSRSRPGRHGLRECHPRVGARLLTRRLPISARITGLRSARYARSLWRCAERLVC
jgi:hypothetical protein